MQARKRLRAILSEIVAERRARGGGGDDLLGGLMRSRDDGTAGAVALLTDDQIADNVVGVLFAAQDTTASVLTWILKYLHDSPKLLEAVKVNATIINQSLSTRSRSSENDGELTTDAFFFPSCRSRARRRSRWRSTWPTRAGSGR